MKLFKEEICEIFQVLLSTMELAHALSFLDKIFVLNLYIRKSAMFMHTALFKMTQCNVTTAISKYTKYHIYILQ